MRRRIMSALVIVITIITVVVMNDIALSNQSPINEIDIKTEEREATTEVEDETGYIFDDYDKGINIKFEEIEKGSKLDYDSYYDYDDYASIYGENRIGLIKALEDGYMFKNGLRSAKETISYSNRQKTEIEKNKNLSSSIQANMTWKEKMSFLKLAKYINPFEILKIKDAISTGTTNQEGREIFNLLEERLPEEEYQNLLNIINKYEAQEVNGR